MKSDLYKILFLLVVVVVIAYFFLLSDSKGKQYIRQQNIVFTGIVVKKKSLEHLRNEHLGIVQLKLQNSTVDFSDDREKPYYFCVISKGMAEIVVSSFMDYNLGDTVEVNSHKNVILVRRNGTVIHSFQINAYDDFSDLGKNLRKEHEIVSNN